MIIFSNISLKLKMSQLETLQSLIDSGILQELNQNQSKRYETNAKCYVVVGEL